MTTETRTKVLLHGCPRCRGDLFLDIEESEYDCLQCGRAFDARLAMGVGRIDALLAQEMARANPRLRLLPVEMEEINDDAA